MYWTLILVVCLHGVCSPLEVPHPYRSFEQCAVDGETAMLTGSYHHYVCVEQALP